MDDLAKQDKFRAGQRHKCRWHAGGSGGGRCAGCGEAGHQLGRRAENVSLLAAKSIVYADPGQGRRASGVILPVLSTSSASPSN